MWRPELVNSGIYNKVDEVQLTSNDVIGIGNRRFAAITLTGNKTVEVQSGDVVGYYHPLDSHYKVGTVQNSNYILYHFGGSDNSRIILNSSTPNDQRQPLIHFIIGKCKLNFKVSNSV